MAIINSGASDALLTIDPTSKASRVTLYDSAGNEINKPPVGSYLAPVNIRHTSGVPATTAVWAMRGGSRTSFIRRIHVLQTFDGVALAASGTLRHEIVRFSGASPTGGTAQLPIKKRNSYPASSAVTINAVDTGTGPATASFGTSTIVFGIPVIQLEVAVPASAATPGNRVLHDLTFEAPWERYGTFELAPFEGFCIRTVSVTTIIGLGLFGFVEWDEC